MMTRVAIYARFSSAMQSEASIEDQLRICRERTEREGWTVCEIFTDMAMSGASMQRPGVQRLMTEASRGNFDIIVAEALDRLSRDQADVATLFKRLSFHGVRIVTLSEGEISELHVGLKGTMNQLFLKDLAAKTHRGLRGRVEAGFSGGGKVIPPFLTGCNSRTYAAIFSFMAGVMPPMPTFGRSLLYVQSHCVA
jgi:site-specific DNA recombinase